MTNQLLHQLAIGGCCGCLLKQGAIFGRIRIRSAMKINCLLQCDLLYAPFSHRTIVRGAQECREERGPKMRFSLAGSASLTPFLRCARMPPEAAYVFDPYAPADGCDDCGSHLSRPDTVNVKGLLSVSFGQGACPAMRRCRSFPGQAAFAAGASSRFPDRWRLLSAPFGSSRSEDPLCSITISQCAEKIMEKNMRTLNCENSHAQDNRIRPGCPPEAAG